MTIYGKDLKVLHVQNGTYNIENIDDNSFLEVLVDNNYQYIFKGKQEIEELAKFLTLKSMFTNYSAIRMSDTNLEKVDEQTK